MRRCSSSELGSYVLEMATVIMGVTAFIVGAADITRIFQARSAVRAAVNEGARCLFPTDAACVERASTGPSYPKNSYDVWVWGSGYEVPQESFIVSARWREEPVFEVPTHKDQISSVTVERQQHQYRPYSMRYPVTAHTTYLLQTRFLPVVIGGSPLDPQFADPLTNTVSRPSATYFLRGIRGSTTRVVSKPASYTEGLKIGAVSFSVRDAWPTMEDDRKDISAMPPTIASSLPCLFGARQQSGLGDTLNWSAGTPRECRYRVRSSTSSPVMDRGMLKVPMMFRVEGDTIGTAEDAQGKVMMALSWKSNSAGSGRVELGGRAINYLGNGKFIPRGLAEVDINSGLRSQYDDYKEELSLYYELPLLPVDATVTLEFYLMSFNGRRVAWKGARVNVWLPQYRLVHQRTDCGYTTDPSICSQPPAPAPIHYLSLSEGAPFKAVVTGEESCALDEEPEAERDLAAVFTRLQGESLRTGIARPYSFHLKVPTIRSVCEPKIVTTPCAAESPEYLEGCNPFLVLDEVASRCGVSSPSSKVLAYTKRSLSSSLKRVRACSDSSLPQCALPAARRVESVRYGGGDACEASIPSNAPQMVIGPLDVTTCEARDEEAERLYRTHEKIPADVPISVVRLPSSPRFSQETPVNSCVSYRSAEGLAGEMICGQNLTEAAAERCCAASGGRCRKQVVVAPSDPTGDAARVEILSAARQRVIEAVQAGYPSAYPQTVCGESLPNCFEVAASLADDDSKAIVSAKVYVPLMLLRPFLGDVTTVEHSTTRELERFG